MRIPSRARSSIRVSNSIAPGPVAGEGPQGRKAADSKPATVGRCIVLSHLGSGGMGRVFLAYDAVIDRRIALKILRGSTDDKASLQEQRLRMYGEARLLAQLDHPNIVDIYDVGTHRRRVDRSRSRPRRLCCRLAGAEVSARARGCWTKPRTSSAAESRPVSSPWPMGASTGVRQRSGRCAELSSTGARAGLRLRDHSSGTYFGDGW